MSFDSRLKMAMEAKGFTQASLAREAGMAQSMIWKLATGASKGTSKIVALAKALDVRPEWLSNGTGPMKESDAEAVGAASGGNSFSLPIYKDFDEKQLLDKRICVPDLTLDDRCKAFYIAENTGCADIPAGSYIVVDIGISPGHNDYVYAKRQNGASVYRFHKIVGSDSYLTLDDTRFPFVSASEFTIKGVIIFALRGFKVTSAA